MTQHKRIHTAFEELKNQHHPTIYLLPEYSANSNHPYYLCNLDGVVLYVSFIDGEWVLPPEKTPKKNVNGLTPLTEEDIFHYSTIL